MPNNHPENNVKLLRLMSRAVNEGLLVADFHPVLHLKHSQSKIYWILCNMTTDTGQLVPYNKLRTLSKMTEMSVALDRWLMHTALSSLKALHQDDPDSKVIVPQSMKSLANPEYPRWLERQAEMENVSLRGLIVAFRLPHIVKVLKPAKRCFSELHKLDALTMIDAFTDHPGAQKILRVMGTRYAHISSTLLNASDDNVRSVIKYCKKRRVALFLSGINKPEEMNLTWSEGADMLEGSYIHPPTQDLQFRFSPVIV